MFFVDPTPEVAGFTALEYGQALLADLTDRVMPLPEERYATLGSAVVTCESLIVTSTGVDAQQLRDVPQCDVVQIGTYLVTVARDCAAMANDDGTTDVGKAMEVSAQMDADAQLLWEWAQGLKFFVTKNFSVSWVITGGLAITTLTLTIGVP